MFVRLLVLAFIFVLQVSAYTCPTAAVNVKYQGLPYAFPSAGTDDHYAASQNCSWIIQVPDGYYINYGWEADLQGGHVRQTEFRGQLHDTQGYQAVAFDELNDIFCDQLNVNLRADRNAAGNFRFNVTWFKKNPPAQAIPVVVNPLSYKIFDMSQMVDQNTVTFSIDSPQQLYLAFDPRNSTDSSQVIVYDGTAVVSGVNYTTLDYDNSLRWVAEDRRRSTKSAITLYSPKAGTDLKMYAIVNDLRVVDQFTYYGAMVVDITTRKVAECEADAGETCAFTVSTTDGQPLSLFAIKYLEGDEPIFAFEGVPANISATPIANFTQEFKPPYHFPASTITFVITPQMQETKLVLLALPISATSEVSGNAIETEQEITRKTVQRVKKTAQGTHQNSSSQLRGQRHLSA